MLAIDQYLLQALMLSSKPAAHRSCCSLMEETDANGRTTITYTLLHILCGQNHKAAKLQDIF